MLYCCCEMKTAAAPEGMRVSAFGYVHSAPPEAKLMGRIGSVVLLAHDEAAATAAAKLGPSLAMHAVAARPQYLDSTSVPEVILLVLVSLTVMRLGGLIWECLHRAN